MSKAIANDLNAAADYIEQNGWCKNTYYDYNGKVCLAGAVGMAIGHLVPRPADEVKADAKKWLADENNTEGWDNAPTTVRQVVKQEYVPIYQEAKSVAKKRRYRKALRALAGVINAERAAHLDEAFAGYADPTYSPHELLVTNYNDNGDIKSKRAVIKLLRTAASNL